MSRNDRWTKIYPFELIKMLEHNILIFEYEKDDFESKYCDFETDKQVNGMGKR